jgi:hypothetical protein
LYYRKKSILSDNAKKERSMTVWAKAAVFNVLDTGDDEGSDVAA